MDNPRGLDDSAITEGIGLGRFSPRANCSVAWSTSGIDAGSPIVTGNVVWDVNISTGQLLGYNFSPGVPEYSFSLKSVDQFITPGAAPGMLLVGAGSELYSFSLE